MTQIFKTDWLASRPVFYNELTGRVSYNINDVINFDNLEFHPEGFNNYLDFGYSILGQTPIKHVKFLEHSSQLTVQDNKRLKIEVFDDPIQAKLDQTWSEDDVFQLLKTTITNWEKSVTGEIVIPTSGGYDSRLLNHFVKDKSRIRSFTYGISMHQGDSYEVVYARKLAEILRTSWEQIELGDYHLYFDNWVKLFGVSTHAHGMYQIEFFSKIRSKVAGDNPLLSGIIGDAWAGSIPYKPLKSAHDLELIGYSHGLKADSSQSRLKAGCGLREAFWEAHNRQLKDWSYQIIWSMRFKIILLSYLFSLPQYFSFKPWSPFLDINIAAAMLSVPSERRQNRVWQREFFQKYGLDLESMGLKVSNRNELNLYALKRKPIEPLDVKLLAEVIKPEYVEWINCQVSPRSVFWDWFWQLGYIPKLGGTMWRLGIREKRLPAYYAYLTLKPIEVLLRQRGQPYAT